MFFSRSSSACKTITAKEAKEMMDKGGVTVLDVRTENEYAQAHIPGATLLPLNQLGAKAETVLPDKDATILVHCLSGGRSRTACSKLTKMGYTNIIDFGGINAWFYETETGM